MGFLGRVVSGFRSNQGFLLASAVAYNTLLSIVPAGALILIMLSRIVDPDMLLQVTGEYLEVMAPGRSQLVLAQIQQFLADWRLVGLLGFAALLFFSALAFTVLENAMSVIFFHRVRIHRRHFLVSAFLPYVYILLLAVGLLVVALVSSALHTLEQQPLHLLGRTWTLHGAETAVVYVLGLLGEVVLLTSFYLVMPLGRLRLSHALLGGTAAAVLWEATRHVLVWYFASLSFVNVIYGSFATVIVILLSLEAAAIILLLGAQVIAEYERLGRAHESDGGLKLK